MTATTNIMKAIVALVPLLLVVNAPAANAFLFGEPMVRHPQLTEMLDAQRDLKVGLHLDIGQEQASVRLAIQQMQLELQMTNNDDSTSTSGTTIPMPGMHGMHPSLSGGVRSLKIQRPGRFISSQGLQYVQPTPASCWELIWKKDAHAGCLLLGLELEEEYQRHHEDSDDQAAASAKLPKGVVYLNFPVWSLEGLAVARAAQAKAIRRAKECLEERDTEIAKLQHTSNWFQKALHYRNAYAAVEAYTLQPLKHYEDIVPKDDKKDCIELPSNLFLTTRGFCWTKELPKGPQHLLGTATLFELA